MKQHPVWPEMNPLARTHRLLAMAVLVRLPTIHGTRAANVTTLDPAFVPGLAKVQRASGFVEDPPHGSTEWKPNLRLLVGVKAVEGSKRTIYFVELTTLPPPTNALSPAWSPALRTNHWTWSASNKAQFVTALYPVRVRVFDETGRQLRGGQTPMAWGMLTNGLMDLCRVSLESYGNPTKAPLTVAKGKKATARPGEEKHPGAPDIRTNDALMRATGGAFLWMFGMFQDFQTVPAVADVWTKAQCAIRWPSAWTIVTSPFRGITLELLPRFEQVALAGAAARNAGPLYRLPVDLHSGKRSLARVDIVVGPAHGAEMLLAGIRSVRARHPTKAKREFLAQVLAAGSARESP